MKSAKQHKYLKQVRMVTLKGFFPFVNPNIGIVAQNFQIKSQLCPQYYFCHNI